MRERDCVPWIRLPVAALLAFACWLVVPAVALEEDAAEGGKPGVEASVVRIFSYANATDLRSPWQKLGTEASSGSGVVIEGGRILTAAHVVADAVSIQLKRAGQPDRFPAEILHVAHDCDLALIRPLDPAFFEGVTAVPLGRLPEVNSEIQAYGFPVGGDTLSVTSGVISRIEVGTYEHSMRELLIAQIDASINPGNSGGPVVADGALVGIALQTLVKAESVGYMAPAPVIAHMLADVKDGRYDGFPNFGVEYQDLESPAQRTALGMKTVESGVLVSRVDFGGPGYGVVSRGEVITAVEGSPIANDGTVALPGLGRVNFEAVVQARQLGETVKLTILKDGSRFDRRITLNPHQPLIAGRVGDEVEYLVFGGLVFQPLGYEYLRQSEEPLETLMSHALGFNIVTEQHRQVILLQQVLPHRVNQGYEEWRDAVVATVNGVAPRDMKDLARILDSATGRWLTIVTEDQGILTLPLEEARAAHAKILASFGVARDRSPGLAVPSAALQAQSVMKP